MPPSLLTSQAALAVRRDAAAAGREHRLGAIWTLVRTDFKVRYHGTAMGFLWALLKPVTMLLVLMTVFSFVFSSDPHYKLNLIVALFLWDFFAEGTRVGLASLHAKAFLLGKTRFPKWMIIAASTANAAFTLLVTSCAMLVILALIGRPPTLLAVGLFAWYVVQLFLIVVAFSLGASVLFLRYRDLNQVWDVVSAAGFFVAPIVYPLGILPERAHVYVYAWPPTPVIQLARSVLVDGVVPTVRAHVLLTAATLVALAVGVTVYRRLASAVTERL